MASTNVPNNSTWKAPRTWSNDEDIDQTIMNAHVKEQLAALYSPAGAYGLIAEAANYTIASTTWADVDATNMAMTFSLEADGVVHVEFHVTVYWVAVAGIGIPCFDINVNGTRYAGNDGLKQGYVTSGGNPALQSLTIAADIPMSAGSNTVKLQWMRYNVATVGIYAGAGTSQHDVHPSMSARRVA